MLELELLDEEALLVLLDEILDELSELLLALLVLDTELVELLLVSST